MTIATLKIQLVNMSIICFCIENKAHMRKIPVSYLSFSEKKIIIIFFKYYFDVKYLLIHLEKQFCIEMHLGHTPRVDSGGVVTHTRATKELGRGNDEGGRTPVPAALLLGAILPKPSNASSRISPSRRLSRAFASSHGLGRFKSFTRVLDEQEREWK